VYTLLSASVLALDLVRHPTGAAVADTVDRALALTPGDVRALAACAADDDEVRGRLRERLLAESAIEPRMSRLMMGVRRAVEDGLPGAAEARTIADVLSETLLGGLGDLLALLGREGPLADPGAPAAGVQVALDAVIAAWCGRGPQGADVAEAFVLAAPWHAGAPLPPPLDDDAYGGAGRELRDLLDEVARLSPERWGRVEQAHTQGSRARSWSGAMHTASKAAADSGRLLPVARAQLAAARALRLSGVSASATARGGAMAVVAAVQSLCVRDRLDTATAQALTAAWKAGA
jgi:hypothetical protein